MYMQWNLVNMNTVKVKYLLNLNHSEIPRQHHYANVATLETKLPLIRTLFCGPLGFILTRFHCTYMYIHMCY